MEFILNCIDYKVYFVIVFTGDMHTIRADMDLEQRAIFLDSVNITLHNP